jgi:hypothetical protein
MKIDEGDLRLLRPVTERINFGWPKADIRHITAQA